jgi:single-stranded-DNA-specific exonuclease
MPMTDMIRQLLKNRAIPEDSWEAFLSPNYVAGTHDPFLMKDMDKAVERILKAIENKENIVVYSDYDCDGIPGAVILHDFFKVINYDNFTVYIPDRHDEGYGLHRDAVESFIAQGTDSEISISVERFRELAQLVLSKIKEADSAAFTIPEIEAFLHQITAFFFQGV